MAAQNGTTRYGDLDHQTTAFSAEFYSLSEHEPLFTYHFTPALLTSQRTSGVATVDSDSVYRVGSVSKLWTVYLYLIAAGDQTWNDPITKYIAELAAISQTQKRDLVNNVNWDSITVGALASQMAGIGRDAAYSAELAGLLGSLGIPDQGGNSHSTCGNVQQSMIPCNRSEFFTDYPTQHPVFASFQTPVYSNAAFQILGYALENITGQTVEAFFEEHLVEGLDLGSTSYTVPAAYNSTGVIPFNTTFSWFTADLLDETPAGGYFSSINDMRTIGKAMLNSSQLDPAVTRRWMKPHTFLSDPDAAVGAPWEIHRAPGSPYLMMMTKSGDLGAYAAYIVLIPELGIGFNILAAGAGSTNNVQIVADMLTETFVPAVRVAAKEQAETLYAGSYSNAAMGSNITLTSEEDQPGLAVQEWSLGGQDVLAILGQAYGTNTTARLYPTGLSTTSSNGTATSAWRAVYQVLPQALDPGPFSSNCISWATMNSRIYGGVGLEEFLFTLAEGKAVGLKPRILDIAMARSG